MPEDSGRGDTLPLFRMAHWAFIRFSCGWPWGGVDQAPLQIAPDHLIMDAVELRRIAPIKVDPITPELEETPLALAVPFEPKMEFLH